MPILTKEVEVKPIGKTIQYYRDLGYDVKCRQPLMVKVEDLPKRSMVRVEVLCDICKENTMMVRYADYTRVTENTGSYVCKKCAGEKFTQTNQKRLGVEYPTQSKLVKDKIKQVCLDKYGVENVSQCEEIKNRKLNTMRERYGVDNPFQYSEFKEKQMNSLYERYGVDSPSKSLEIKERISKTFYQNGTKISSKQQRYLCELYNGELNYPIKHYSADICFPDEKLCVEYDGGGHNLQVKLGNETEEEYNQKEIIRNNIIKREGYKQMRIISIHDKLPNDEILIQMLLDAKQYFYETDHSWVYYDIDNSIMINAENKSMGGVFYDYGVLRNIKEVAA